jgi:hypothetical protein
VRIWEQRKDAIDHGQRPATTRMRRAAKLGENESTLPVPSQGKGPPARQDPAARRHGGRPDADPQRVRPGARVEAESAAGPKISSRATDAEQQRPPDRHRSGAGTRGEGAGTGGEPEPREPRRGRAPPQRRSKARRSRSNRHDRNQPARPQPTGTTATNRRDRAQVGVPAGRFGSIMMATAATRHSAPAVRNDDV